MDIKNLILCHGAMWGLATWIFASIIFGLYGTWYGHKMRPQLENSMFYTFTHFAWGIGVAMVIFSCVNGIITDFFSMKIWAALLMVSH